MSKLSVFSSALVLGFSTCVQAQDATQLDRMVVTASRTPVDSQRIGASITIIDRETIERRQSRFLADLLRDVPGFSVSRSGGAGAQVQVRVRGSEANQVLVLIDGVEANDPAIGDEFQFAHMLTSQIERVEIVRGPQSSLWGSDAMAGVINIITRAPESTGLAARFEGGSFETVHGGVDGRWQGERASLQLSADYLDTDGTNIARSGSEEDGYENTTLGLSGKFAATSTLTLDANLRYTDSTNDFDSVDFFVTGLPVDADQYSEIEQTLLSINASWTNFDGRLDSVASFKLTDTDNDNFSSGFPSGSTAAQKTGFYLQSTIDLGQTAAGSHALTLAVDHEETEFEQRGVASPFGDPNQDQDIEVTGFVAEYRGGLFNGFELAASVRRDDNSDFKDKTTYRVSGNYLIGSDTRVWGAYGTAQKDPTFTERYGFFANTFVGNPNLNPEESKGWEFGIEATVLSGALTGSLAVFQEDLEDEINGFFFDPTNFTFTAVNVDGESERQGVEAALSWRINPAFNLQSSYTYIDSVQPEANGQMKDELRRPRHVGHLGLSYAPVGKPFDLTANLSVNGEAQDLFFPPFPQPSQRVELDSYALLDLTVRYMINDNLTVHARGENLLDEDYENVFGFANPGAAGYIGLRWDF